MYIYKEILFGNLKNDFDKFFKLVGVVSSFRLRQAMYNSFSTSIHRWVIMLQCVEDSDNEYQQESALVLKRVNDTRWCAIADATKAVSEGYSCFQKALQVINGEMNQKPQVIHEAKCLLNDVSKNEHVIIASFWAVILNRIN